jgi:hypothetical protein
MIPILRRVGITAAVATLVGYASGLFYGFSLRVLFTGSLYWLIIRIICSELLCSISRQYIWGQLPVKLTIIKQFNLFYAAHISLLLL